MNNKSTLDINITYENLKLYGFLYNMFYIFLFLFILSVLNIENWKGITSSIILFILTAYTKYLQIFFVIWLKRGKKI